MTARRCFTGKIASGIVSERAGKKLLDVLDEFERVHGVTPGDETAARAAAADAIVTVTADAARAADDARDAIIRQANILRMVGGYEKTVADLRATPGVLGFGNKAPPGLGKDQTSLGFALRSMLARDPFEIANWGNVNKAVQFVREEAHRRFAEAIDYLRPKGLGFKAETARELDVLRAAYGETASAEAAAVYRAWDETAGYLADSFIAEGGQLSKRATWRIPNPRIDAAKARALGTDGFKQLARDIADRRDILDFETGKPMSDAKFEAVLDEVTRDIMEGGDGLPSATQRGARSVGNSRTFARFFAIKDAESWMRFAETVGEHASVFETMTGHIAGMAEDVGLMKVMGRNPDATMRFMLDLMEREPGRLRVEGDPADPKSIAKAAKANKAIENRVRVEKRLLEDLYAEVTGANRNPVNMTLARTLADARHWLSAAQLGSAIISSITDTGTLAMASRFNGLPVAGTLARATQMMSQKGAEVFAAQQGIVMDTLAHAVGQADRVMGENIRTGVAAKVSNANIRLSGLRRWTAVLRAAFGLEMMAHVARERGTAFADIAPDFRAALDRYGIAEADWKLIAEAIPHEPRPGATFTRAVDVAEGGSAAHRSAAEKLSRLVNTEMDYAVIESDPVTRALLIGQSRPGTAGGEVRRAVTMYRAFPATFMMMHFARAAARGWDGSRLGHAAISFVTMMGLGAAAMQAKEILAGRDPLSLDPTSPHGLRAWGKATLQGGGLGVFGDLLFIDQTKYGNSWAATAAGPLASSVETVLGDFVFKNVQLAGKGERTHFLGDALYAAGRHLPGSSLWFARLQFQRRVLDQLALMADPRAGERFARIEDQARKEWGQDYWHRPGRADISRAPAFDAVMGGR